MFLRSKERRFWSWFAKNERMLFETDSREPEIGAQLKTALQRVHRGLTWEISRIQEGKRQFVISADGITENFSAVERLADAAPSLPRWTVIRFRPRFEGYHEIRLDMNGTSLRAEEVECAMSLDGSLVALDIFVPADVPESERMGISFLFLDAALGEYDVACKIGRIGFHARDTETSLHDRFPYPELRARFDRFFDENCTGHHS